MATDSVKTEVGSYFISNYPPFSQWTTDAVTEVQQAMQSPPANVPLGLYLHIPFCRKRCKFCYFKVFTDVKSSDIETYVQALSHEIELVSQLPVMGDRPFRFVYFGGGTPSFLGIRQLKSLEARLRSSISWEKAEEVTFECEPGTLSESKIKTLREIGVTRLSLGIENFSDKVLEENGRAHLSAEIYRSWEWIQDAQFPNVNIDLISGMVGETWDNWKDSVRRTVELAPESVTIYQMELPYNTVYSKDILGNKIETPVADWPTKRAWVDYAFDELAAAGYSVSSAYTMVKDPSKVNFSYRDNLWMGSDLIATGIASFGHVSGVHYQNLPDWNAYLDPLLREDRLPLGRAMLPTARQRLIREMILQLKRGYLDAGYFRDKFQAEIIREWADEWRSHEQQGMLSIDGDRVQLTRKGLLHADALLPAFFEPEHRECLHMSGVLEFMMGNFRAEFPTDRLYARNHMWAQPNGHPTKDGSESHTTRHTLRFGFTAYAVRLLQDVYFLEWHIDPESGIRERQLIGAVESKKAESELFAPIAGTVLKFNKTLITDPSWINVDKYDQGWLFTMSGSTEPLLQPRQYLEHLDAVWEVTQRTIKGQF